MTEVQAYQPLAGPSGSLTRRDPLMMDTTMDDVSPLSSPTPNPPFVFPPPSEISQGLESDQTKSQRHSSRGAPRSLNRNKPQSLSISPLPVFQFGGDAPPNRSSPSPTPSPARTTPPIHAHGGHRRGGSEFVGGNAVNPITASASPNKQETFNFPSTTPPVQTAPPRRGHAHKRSGALSQHDLSAILKPVGHAPSTSEAHGQSPVAVSRSMNMDFVRPRMSNRAESSDSLASTASQEGLAVPRSKVTFSSDPEYILRPLSTISSETSSSLSTIRPGHSVNDSINSIVSGDNTSPSSSRKLRSTLNDLAEADPSRSIDSSPSEVPAAESGADYSSYRKHIIPEFDEHQSLSGSAFQPSPSEESEAMVFSQGEQSSITSALNSPLESQEPPFHKYSRQDGDTERPRTSPEPKAPKRQRKVRSWAGLIKKPRQAFDQQSKPTGQDITGDLPSSMAANNFSLDNVSFDEDTTCIIENGPPSNSEFRATSLKTPIWSAANVQDNSDEDGHMLDLDVALGSSESGRPSGRPAEHMGKRRMHSSEKMTGFVGPGMHYHRRAESMPELDLFEQSQLGFGHRSSNPAMSEAIEEEEEDEDEEVTASTQPTKQISNEPALGVHVVEARSSQEHASAKRRPFGRTDLRVSKSTDFNIRPSLDAVEIVSTDDEPRISTTARPLDDSLPTPKTSKDQFLYQPQESPQLMEHPFTSSLNTPQTPCSMPSPDFSKSSFDKHNDARIHTAHSSITDRVTLNSARNGDQRMMSVDDVPSLTSSASTMISGHPTHYPSLVSAPFPTAERSFSLTDTAPPRVRSGNSSKRSSLVSLSRLVGGTHNKSKLNIAELAPPDSPEKPEKKKAKRMSRLKFWRSKEKLTSS